MIISYPQCKYFCDANNDDWFGDDCRLPAVEKKYTTNKQKIKDSGLSLEQYIINNEMTRHGVELDLVVTFNKFPYNVDCDHLLYWYKEGFRETAEAAINKIFATQEFCYAEAPLARRTIPGLGHFHIFIKK